MDNAVFILEEGTDNWRYKNLIICQIEKNEWKIQYEHGFQIYESVYDVMDYITRNFNVNPVFKVPESVDDLPVST